MTIKTFLKKSYKDCPIYIRCFGNTFEYLVIIKNELYATNISVKPKLINNILHTLKIKKDLYSEKELVDIGKYLLKMCETTVDTVLKV